MFTLDIYDSSFLGYSTSTTPSYDLYSALMGYELSSTYIPSSSGNGYNFQSHWPPSQEYNAYSAELNGCNTSHSSYGYDSDASYSNYSLTYVLNTSNEEYTLLFDPTPSYVGYTPTYYDYTSYPTHIPSYNVVTPYPIYIDTTETSFTNHSSSTYPCYKPTILPNKPFSSPYSAPDESLPPLGSMHDYVEQLLAKMLEGSNIYTI